MYSGESSDSEESLVVPETVEILKSGALGLKIPQLSTSSPSINARYSVAETTAISGG